MTKFYAVRIGRKKGIFKSWNVCKKQIHKFKGAKFKSFINENDALNYMKGLEVNKEKEEKEKKEKKEEKGKYFKGIENKDDLFFEYKNKSSQRLMFEKKRNENIKKKYLYLFTDGSCFNKNHNSNQVAGCGVYFPSNQPLFKITHQHFVRDISEPLSSEFNPPTNQKAELYAVYLALKQLENFSVNLKIIVDSKYICDIFEDDSGILSSNENTMFKVKHNRKRFLKKGWIWKWIQNNFVLNNGEKVKNKELIQVIFKLLQKRDKDVRFIFTNSHKNVDGNEIADKLAKEGALKS